MIDILVKLFGNPLVMGVLAVCFVLGSLVLFYFQISVVYLIITSLFPVLLWFVDWKGSTQPQIPMPLYWSISALVVVLMFVGFLFCGVLNAQIIELWFPTTTACNHQLPIYGKWWGVCNG